MTGLEQLEIAPLKAAAKTLGVDQRKLRRVLSEARIPVIRLGQRGQGVLVSHLQRLIIASAKPAIEIKETHV